MTQDLLFNLSGAWHVYSGHVAHVDFHDASGRLSFLLTALGFPSARAYALCLPGQRGVHGRRPVRGVVPGRDAAPAAAAGRPLRGVYKPARPDAGECRGPTRAAHLRDVLQSLRLERLRHPGADPVRAAARGTGSKAGAWIDIAVAGGLLAAMFYLKITYFAAGLATLGFAVLFHPHVGRYWRAWLVVGALLVLNALAPHNQPYLAGILGWATSGAVRKAATLPFNNFVAAIDRYGPYLARRRGGAVDVVVGTGDVPPAADARFPLLVMSLLLLSQNSQAAGIAVGHRRAVRALRPAAHRLLLLGNRDVAPWLLTLLLFPLFAVSGVATSIAGYHANARDGRGGLHVVERTNLAGLAVPEGQRGTFLSFSHSFDYPSRPADAPAQPLYQLSDYEYVLVLADAADTSRAADPAVCPAGQRQSPALRAGRRARTRGESCGRRGVRPSGRPANSWPARYVLVPKFATSPQWTDDMMRLLAATWRSTSRWAAEAPCLVLLVDASSPDLPSQRAPQGIFSGRRAPMAAADVISPTRRPGDGEAADRFFSQVHGLVCTSRTM